MMSLSATRRVAVGREQIDRLFPHAAGSRNKFHPAWAFLTETKVIGLVGSEANPLPAAPEDGICVPPNRLLLPLSAFAA